MSDTAAKRPRGRPPGSKNKEPQPVVLDTIEVSDQRPELKPRHLASHKAPSDLTKKEVIERYGIAEHLHVVRVSGVDGSREVLQEGRR